MSRASEPENKSCLLDYLEVPSKVVYRTLNFHTIGLI